MSGLKSYIHLGITQIFVTTLSLSSLDIHRHHSVFDSLTSTLTAALSELTFINPLRSRTRKASYKASLKKKKKKRVYGQKKKNIPVFHTVSF